MADTDNIEKTGQIQTSPVNVNAFYINSANVALTATEIQLHLLLNGSPIVIAIMPFPVAKTFANTILAAIKSYENSSGIKVQELNEIMSTMQKSK